MNDRRASGVAYSHIFSLRDSQIIFANCEEQKRSSPKDLHPAKRDREECDP